VNPKQTKPTRRSKPKRSTRRAQASALLMNEQATAEQLLVSVRTLQRWRVSGGGPPFVKLGGLVFYRPEDVSEHIAGRVRSSTSAA
jgi:hypothetical protein